jgi:hypothetical protein
VGVARVQDEPPLRCRREPDPGLHERSLGYHAARSASGIGAAVAARAVKNHVVVVEGVAVVACDA